MDIQVGIDFKNEAIASIDRMMEEVLDDHDEFL